MFNPAPGCYIDGEDFDEVGHAKQAALLSVRGLICFMFVFAPRAVELVSVHEPSERGNNLCVESSPENGGSVWFVSHRSIAAGEELLYSYGDEYWNPDEAEKTPRAKGQEVIS